MSARSYIALSSFNNPLFRWQIFNSPFSGLQRLFFFYDARQWLGCAERDHGEQRVNQAVKTSTSVSGSSPMSQTTKEESKIYFLPQITSSLLKKNEGPDLCWCRVRDRWSPTSIKFNIKSVLLPLGTILQNATFWGDITAAGFFFALHMVYHAEKARSSERQYLLIWKSNC